MGIDKNKLLDALEEKYGDLNDNCGCYVNNEWLSVKQIVEIINDWRLTC